MSKLTPKQQRFVEEYLIDLNATQAAIRAGYSKKTAYRTGADNLKKPQIAELLEKRSSERSGRTQTDADYVLTRLREIDELDIADILDDAGKVKPVTQWPKPWRQSITGADLHELQVGDVMTVVRKIKWPDKLRTLELIGKHVSVKAFEESQQGGSEDLAKALSDLADKLPG